LVYVILRRCKDGENILEWEMDDWGHVDRVDESAPNDDEQVDEEDVEVELTKEGEQDSTET